MYLAFYVNWQIKSLTDGVVIIVFILISLGTFVWPVLGAHRLLQQAKARWKGEVTRRVEAITGELHRRVDRQDLQGMEAVKAALDGLVVEQGLVRKVSTWPWDPEAVRAVISTLLLPVVLWAITRVLERLGF